MAQKATAKALIDHRGTLCSEEIGANIARDTSQELFHCLICALMMSARIRPRMPWKARMPCVMPDFTRSMRSSRRTAGTLCGFLTRAFTHATTGRRRITSARRRTCRACRKGPGASGRWARTGGACRLSRAVRPNRGGADPGGARRPSGRSAGGGLVRFPGLQLGNPPERLFAGVAGIRAKAGGSGMEGKRAAVSVPMA
jgi:hypothetical protein